MNVEELMAQTRDAITVKRVFGDPYERNGVTIIPAASVRGGLGAGGGHDAENNTEGSGGGIGIMAHPAGVFVVKDGDVSWRPALDVNRVILGGQVVAVVALLTFRSVLRRRARARAAVAKWNSALAAGSRRS
ncbi:MAG TPA: spore germination protein GerW family protein [Acidimicrobiales bacterium]|nr:spore germination protein GerW family protein [Acidimicrobiales bacterium]